MPTSAGIKPKLDEDPSSRYSTSAIEDDDRGDDTLTINDVASLKQGIIKTAKNQAKAPYTILLLGETGVGKSSVLEFIANVLAGNDTDHYDFDILDRTTEQGGSNNRSQTNGSRWYEFTSNNGITIRILDTPGLADTRSIQQDELHKRNIATQEKEHIDSITAVLILANGAVPRVTVGLSNLFAMFPTSLAPKISFMFTNVLSPLHWNFSLETIPHELRGAHQFLLNNPIALQREYLKLKDDPSMKKRRADMRSAVKASEQNGLQMLVELFDWLDSLEPRGTTEIIPRPQRREAVSTSLAPIAINSAGMKQSLFQKLFKPPWSRRGKKPR